jgi:hypothetical protein
MSPNFHVEWLTLRILKVPGSDLDPEGGYPRDVAFPLVPPGT